MSSLPEYLKQLADAGYGTYRPHYSGRGMYGVSCVGFDTDDPDEVKYRVRAAGFPSPTTDRMGLGWILYWPGVSGQALNEETGHDQ